MVAAAVRGGPNPPRWFGGAVALAGVAVAAAVSFAGFGWWLVLPALSLTGLLSLYGGYLLAPLGGFSGGALLWGFEMATLPAAPLARLGEVLGRLVGVSPLLAEALGPLLLGIGGALAATTLAGAVRTIAAWRVR